MNPHPIYYKTIEVDSLNIFYREAGPQHAPVILLMHGFPSSSFMYRNLIEKLKDRYHLIAPDYPGFGYSSFPDADHFEYSFENLSRVMEKFVDTLRLSSFSMFIQDYGSPVGLRLLTRRPELLQCLIVQNGNAYLPFVTTLCGYLFCTLDDKFNMNCRRNPIPITEAQPITLYHKKLMPVVRNTTITIISARMAATKTAWDRIYRM